MYSGARYVVSDRPYKAARNSLVDPQESDCDDNASDFSDSISSSHSVQCGHSINNDSDFSNTFTAQAPIRTLPPGNLVTSNVIYERTQRDSQDVDAEQKQGNSNKPIYNNCATHQNKLKSHIRGRGGHLCFPIGPKTEVDDVEILISI